MEKCKCGFAIHIPKFCPECGEPIIKPEPPKPPVPQNVEFIPVEFPDVLTATLISEHLHLSKSCVYHLFNLKTSAGGIPSFKVGKSPRVRREDYLAWLETRPTNINTKTFERS